MPRQLTIRNVPDAVAKRLDRLSRERDESLNSTVVNLLTEAVSYEARRERLNRYVTWTDADVTAFNEALRAQRTIDDDLWR
jgi:plasmid stability protein